MTDKQKEILLSANMNLKEVLDRMNGSENVLNICLKSFLEDSSFNEMNTAIEKSDWENAFASAHALKGVSGNMGFTLLYNASIELVELLRIGKNNEISIPLRNVNDEYKKVISSINQYFM